MSFICGKCHIPTKDGVKPKRVVTQTREKIYNPGGHRGTEVVKEELHCPTCASVDNTTAEANAILGSV